MLVSLGNKKIFFLLKEQIVKVKVETSSIEGEGDTASMFFSLGCRNSKKKIEFRKRRRRHRGSSYRCSGKTGGLQKIDRDWQVPISRILLQLHCAANLNCGMWLVLFFLFTYIDMDRG